MVVDDQPLLSSTDQEGGTAVRDVNVEKLRLLLMLWRVVHWNILLIAPFKMFVFRLVLNPPKKWAKQSIIYSFATD
jgi:hypothetical protein